MLPETRISLLSSGRYSQEQNRGQEEGSFSLLGSFDPRSYWALFVFLVFRPRFASPLRESLSRDSQEWNRQKSCQEPKTSVLDSFSRLTKSFLISNQGHGNHEIDERKSLGHG
jgi:hypothetical protein